MKKIIICLWALIVCCWGCEDYLNVKPSNVQAIRTYDEVKALLGGHLRSMPSPITTIWRELQSPISKMTSGPSSTFTGMTLTWTPTLKTAIYSGI